MTISHTIAVIFAATAPTSKMATETVQLAICQLTCFRGFIKIHMRWSGSVLVLLIWCVRTSGSMNETTWTKPAEDIIVVIKVECKPQAYLIFDLYIHNHRYYNLTPAQPFLKQLPRRAAMSGPPFHPRRRASKLAEIEAIEAKLKIDKDLILLGDSIIRNM